MGKIKGDITLRGLRVREAPGHEMLEGVLFPWTDVHIMASTPMVALPVMWHAGRPRRPHQLACTIPLNDKGTALRAQKRAIREHLSERESRITLWLKPHEVTQRDSRILWGLMWTILLVGVVLALIGHRGLGIMIIFLVVADAPLAYLVFRRAALPHVEAMTSQSLELWQRGERRSVRFRDIRSILEQESSVFLCRDTDQSKFAFRVRTKGESFALRTICERYHPGIVCDWYGKDRMYTQYFRPFIVALPFAMAILWAFHVWVLPLPAQVFIGFPMAIFTFASLPWIIKLVMTPFVMLEERSNKRKRAKSRARAE